MQTTLIRLKGVTFVNDSLPVIRDYKSLVAADSSCQAIWRFDIPELVNLDSAGGILSVASWKDASTLLSFSAGSAKATLVSKSKGGVVAKLPSGAYYQAAANIKLFGNLPYSILVICKPASYSTQMGIAGAPRVTGGGGENIRIESLTGSVPIMRSVRGAAVPYAVVGDTAQPVGFLSSFDGARVRSSNLFGDTSVATEQAVAPDTGLNFLLGAPAPLAFSGEVDMVALFNKDVSLDATLLANIKEFARMRIASIS